MNFNLKRPCRLCPFRYNIKGFLTKERVKDLESGLIDQQATFTCHETNEYDDETGEGIESKESKHCAGALILLEKLESPNQMMRISERLGFYDRRKLDMEAPVFDSFDDMIDAQEI